MTTKERDAQFRKEYFALLDKLNELPPRTPGIRVYGDYTPDRVASGGGSRLVAATSENE